jgi:hypothetical protein
MELLAVDQPSVVTRKMQRKRRVGHRPQLEAKYEGLCDCVRVSKKKKGGKSNPAPDSKCARGVRSAGLWKALTYTFPHHKH